LKQDTNHISRPNQMRFIIYMLLVLILSFGIRVIFLRNFRWGYDEGIHVLLARLLAADYTPYSELFVSYPPLFVWSLEYPWRLWRSVEALQLTMTVYALLGVGAVGFIAYRLGGALAGVMAAIFLSLSTTYLDGSRAVMTEVPSVGVAALAVAFAAQYYWSGRRRWLFISGLLTTASLMLKILSPFILGLIPLMILVYHWLQSKNNANRIALTLKGSLLDGLLWGVGVLVPWLVVALIYDAKAMYRQVITFRFDTRAEYSEDWSENLEMLLTFARANIPLLLLAIWGIAMVWVKRWRAGWFVLLWLVLAIAFAMMQVPLREKHLPLLLPPLMVLAGLGLGWLWQLLRQLWHFWHLAALVGYLALAAVLGLYVWQIGGEFSSYRETTTTPLNQGDQILADYIRRYTAPNDCVISDNPTLIFYSERLTPPNLSEVSSARLRSGYLSYDELVEALETHQCQVTAPIAKRLHRTRGDFVEWAKERHVGLWLYDGAGEALLAQPLTNPQPASALDTKLGEQVKLVGYDLFQPERDRDEGIYVSLYWQTLQPFAEDYTVFVHLRDPANNTVANGDHQPYNNLVPTRHWPVGETIKESIRIDLPPELPAGSYRLLVGMYSPQTLERLPVENDATGENAVDLGTAHIP